MLEKFLAENVWLVILSSGLIGAVLRHYVKRDYSLVQTALQPVTCNYFRQEMAQTWEKRCAECSNKIDMELLECKRNVSQISQVQKELSVMRQIQNLELWILSAMCQSINSSPSVTQKVDCKKIEEASARLLDT